MTQLDQLLKRTSPSALRDYLTQQRNTSLVDLADAASLRMSPMGQRGAHARAVACDRAMAALAASRPIPDTGALVVLCEALRHLHNLTAAERTAMLVEYEL